jgi:hypothetical protein
MPTKKIVDVGPGHPARSALPKRLQDVICYWIAQTVPEDPQSGCLAIGPDGQRGF